MKRLILMLFATTFLLFACNNEKKSEEKTSAEVSSDTATTDTPKDKAWIPIDSAMMEKAWKESMALGAPHKMLAKGAGTWNGDVTMWMANGAPPMKSSASMVTTMTFNGLYQQSKHKGEMMGAPFEGMSTTGYDNTKKEFFSTWIDNMGSGILVTTGNWDDANKTLTLSGTMKNPANGLDCSIKEVYKMIDDNNQVLEMYGPDPQTGQQFKTMEIKYTRKK